MIWSALDVISMADVRSVLGIKIPGAGGAYMYAYRYEVSDRRCVCVAVHRWCLLSVARDAQSQSAKKNLE